VSVTDEQRVAAEAGPSDENGVPESERVGHDDLSGSNVRRRAITGAVVDILRAVGVQGLGVLGTLVTARLLTPYDFGLVAIGTTVLAFGDFLDDGGVGTALIRRPESPTRSELKALVAFQLGLDLLIVVGVGLATLPLGELGRVTTLIVASLLPGSFRAAAYIVYERRLQYRPLAVVELVQTTVYYAWAITTILLGWGVWGLATAFLARELCALALVLVLLPEARLLPRPSWSKVRPLLGFGFRYQGVALAHMLRDQGINIALATFGGVAVLGLWGIAWRIIQIPVALFTALWRVSFPGMSRLVAAEGDVGDTIERVIALVAIGTGVLVVPLSASASAWISVLIGGQWAHASSAVPPACIAMMFGVPISVALAGYLLAIGEASLPLRAAILTIPAAAVIVLPLLGTLGVAAAGLSYIGSALVESLLFIWAARQTTSFRIGARLVVPVAIGIAAAACGWLLARSIGPDLAGALASSAVALGAFLAGLAIARRADLTDACNLIARGLRGAVSKATAA
jgi:O-antigen/teichoic acid export membrane protein